MNLKISTLAGFAGALSLLAGAAHAATAFDANLAAPGVYFGSGNSNGHFTIETVDGVELGLRARQGPPHALDAVSPVGNLYQVALGENISFDFSFNPGADGTPVSLDGLTTLITITNLAGGSASFPAHLIPDNAHDLGAPGGFQNSERLSFAIFNGGLFGDINYDNLVNSTYRIDFTVSGTNFATISDTILVNQGAGLAAVPEPTTWALTIAGFGLAGAALRRRRALAAI